ncbi:MAG: erythromycin esterase family protein [Verrucomicrobiota bacterium]
MNTSVQSELAAEIQHYSHPLTGNKTDFEPLLERIGSARYVLLGEATHGTHEYYKTLAELTKILIRKHGFTIVAWEADWPDALRINRYIRGGSEIQNALGALEDFKRFPVWMWRNSVILDLVGWLKTYNEDLKSGPKIGVYGMDLYSLHSSMNAVIDYLEKVNPQAAAEARKRYACFEDFGDDPQTYGMTAALHRSLSCEEEVVKQLVDMQKRESDFLRHDGKMAEDELFYAEQNALVAKNAENYYRAMYRGRPNTWNLRDTHMVDTLDNLMAHFAKQGENPKVVIWAHNSHLGDARATQMSRRDELNVGQLMRERHGDDAVLVGFTTDHGTVTAASDWGGVTERKRVRPGMGGSYERLFHEADAGNFMLIFREHPEFARELNRSMLERAIGVIYLPETERYSHYFFADIADQFDAVLHFDETRAVEPLDRTSEWDSAELPETFPSGY